LTNSGSLSKELFILKSQLADAEPIVNNFVKEFQKAADKKSVKVDVKDSNQVP
jgi:hypothetical protein